jgi:hypothetical protein
MLHIMYVAISLRMQDAIFTHFSFVYKIYVRRKLEEFPQIKFFLKLTSTNRTSLKLEGDLLSDALK